MVLALLVEGGDNHVAAAVFVWDDHTHDDRLLVDIGTGTPRIHDIPGNLRCTRRLLAWISGKSESDLRAQWQQWAVPADIPVRLLSRLRAPVPKSTSMPESSSGLYHIFLRGGEPCS
jgi:hypothetical protein